jgi:guanosine-3',5'-bis(diphosphate) 3'-pyrophosphohydrolase
MEMQASPSVNAMPAGAPPRAAANAAAASFAALTDSLDYLDNASIEQVRQAYRFADEAHLGQLRKNGEPYITHPIAVAAQCATWKLDAQALMAALLHDAMEDCGVTKMDLIERFGAPVAELVDGLTKLDKLEFDTREENQAESFRKMLLAMARDVRVILIKLADRSHNMRTLSDMPRSKWRRISSETLEIYAPIAHRLGLNQTYRELQDLSFRTCTPGATPPWPRPWARRATAGVTWCRKCRPMSMLPSHAWACRCAWPGAKRPFTPSTRRWCSST